MGRGSFRSGGTGLASDERHSKSYPLLSFAIDATIAYRQIGQPGGRGVLPEPGLALAGNHILMEAQRGTLSNSNPTVSKLWLQQGTYMGHVQIADSR